MEGFGMQILFIRYFVTISLLLCAGNATLRAETIVIKGSDTLGAKLIPQLAEGYRSHLKQVGTTASFEISAEGSSTGIAAILDGSADIGMLSRPLDRSEIKQAEARGIQLQFHEIAQDGLAIIVNEKNPLKSLTSTEVEKIFTGDYANWAALSHLAGDISIYTRGTASGTYGTFQALALNHRNYSSSSQKMAGNEQIVAEVAKNPYGIGYIGMAYSLSPGIRILEIDSGLPNQPDYVYERPLYFLTNAKESKGSQAADFIAFCQSERGQLIVERVHFKPIGEQP